MTKLQLLNAFLSERLAALVREVVAAVEDAVSEYREETARTRRENESLRRQLRDILLLEAETEWLSKGRAGGERRARRVALKPSRLRFTAVWRRNAAGPSVSRVDVKPFVHSALLKWTDSVQVFRQSGPLVSCHLSLRPLPPSIRSFRTIPNPRVCSTI